MPSHGPGPVQVATFKLAKDAPATGSTRTQSLQHLTTRRMCPSINEAGFTPGVINVIRPSSSFLISTEFRQ
jgi:hypothetical protein